MGACRLLKYRGTISGLHFQGIDLFGLFGPAGQLADGRDGQGLDRVGHDGSSVGLAALAAEDRLTPTKAGHNLWMLAVWAMQINWHDVSSFTLDLPVIVASNTLWSR